MVMTRQQIADWLDEYFATANAKQGDLDTVPEIGKYFADELEFWMYTAPPFLVPPLSKDELLMTFVHPGLQEDLTPQYYVIDPDTMKAVVQFEIRFRHEASGKAWRKLQASAHYHLRAGTGGALQITKILYWTQSSNPEDDFESMYDVWAQAKLGALSALATRRLRQEL
jgi:hypothetical protein